jgi:hypothetical protein
MGHFVAYLKFPLRLQYSFSELPAMKLQQISKYYLRFISELLRDYSSWGEKKYPSQELVEATFIGQSRLVSAAGILFFIMR